MRTAEWLREATRLRLRWELDESRGVLRLKLFIGNLWLFIFALVAIFSALTLLR